MISRTIFILVFTIPFFAHVFYIVPDADDYCYAADALEFGYFENIWHTYVHWSGRLASTALISLPLYLQAKLSLPFIDAYQAASAVLVLFFVTGLYIFFRTSRLTLRAGDGLFLSLLTLAATIALSARVRDLFFWHSASFTYTVPGILYICLIAQLYRMTFAERQASHATVAVVSGACLLTATFNEYTGLSLVSMSALSLFALALRGRLDWRRLYPPSLFAASSLAGALMVVFAPGNDVRMSWYTGRPDLPTAIVRGLLNFHDYVNFQFINLSLVLYGVIVFVFFLYFRPSADQHRGRFPDMGLFFILAWLVLSVLGFVAASYGTGVDLPERAQNQLQIVGTAAMAILVGSCALTYGDRLGQYLRAKAPSLTTWKGTLLAALLLALVVNPITVRTAVHLFDRSEAVFAEQVERFRLIEEGPDEVRVPATTIFSGFVSPRPLSTSASDWINECMARFFGKRSIAAEAKGDLQEQLTQSAP